MSNAPVTIVMTTWFTESRRIEIAENTLHTWSTYLHYDGELRLHVADDGSSLLFDPTNEWYDSATITYSRQERRGVGASLNAGCKEAFKVSPLVLYAVDDWALTEDLDITPWCKVLLNDKRIGIIRLGPPHPFMRGLVEIISTDWQGWALKCDPCGMVVAHRPALYHQRFFERYGWWDECINACETERRMNERWASDPDRLNIYLALPHKWYHSMDVPSLSEVEPA